MVKAINDAVAEARHDPESLERLRATFTKEGIPPEFLSHYVPDGPFACLRQNDGLSDNF